MRILHTFITLLATALALDFHDQIYESDSGRKNLVTSLHRREASKSVAKLSTRGFELKVPFYSSNLREVLNMFHRNQVKPMGESLLQLDLTGAGDNVPITSKQTLQLAAAKKLWQDHRLDKAMITLPKFVKRTTGLDIFVDEILKTLKNYKARLDRIEATLEAKKSKQLLAAHTNQIAVGHKARG